MITDIETDIQESGITDTRQLQLESDINAVATKVRTLQQQILLLHNKQRKQDEFVTASVQKIWTALEQHINTEETWRAQHDKTTASILATLELIRVNSVGDAVASANRWALSFKILLGIMVLLSALWLMHKKEIFEISTVLGVLK